jgi:hypothetical protein
MAFKPIAGVCDDIDKFCSVTADGTYWIRAYHPGARQHYWNQKKEHWKSWAKWVKKAPRGTNCLK